MPRAKTPRGAFAMSLSEAVRGNDAYRRVLHTGERMQVVAMTLGPGESIGREAHARVEQLFVVQEGRALAYVGDKHYALESGDMLAVPRGHTHDVANRSRTAPLRLITIYAPPNHIDGTVHRTRADAERDVADEAFGRRVR